MPQYSFQESGGAYADYAGRGSAKHQQQHRQRGADPDGHCTPRTTSMASTPSPHSSADADEFQYEQPLYANANANSFANAAQVGPRVSFSAGAAPLPPPPPARPYGHIPRPDPINQRGNSGYGDDGRSTSDETGMTNMTGDTKARLFKVVNKQFKMVKSLNRANEQNAAELERMRREKDEVERKYRSMKKHAIHNQAGGSGGGVVVGQQSEDDSTVATPYTVNTELHDYGGGGPRVEMYDSRGLGPRATFPGGGRSGSDPSIDAFSTVVYPSARNVGQPPEAARPVLKKKSSWRKSRSRSSKRGGGSKSPAKNYAAPLPEATGQGKGTTCGSRCWASFAFACTFFVPDFLICKSGPGAKQAWREKVAICVCAVLVSAFFVGFFGFVPLFFCSETDTYSFRDIWAKDREAWTVVHGTIYDMKDYMNVHPGGSQGIVEWLGKDSSKMFPRIPPADLPNKCLNTDKDMDNFSQMQCVDMTDLDMLLELPCHKDVSKARLGVDKWLGDYKVGKLAYHGPSLSNGGEGNFDWVVIRDKVYNVTNYVNDLKDENSGKIIKDPDESDYAYLTPSLHSLIVNKLNEDATEVYEKLYATDDYIDCLDELFYVGVIDTRDNPACRALNIIMYTMLIFVAALLVLQCLCSLMYLARPHRAFLAKDGESPVMVMVPCYNEGDKELRKTINSVVETHYPSDNKVMVVVADGNITGKGEGMSTPETLSKILGFDIDENEDSSYAYRSIGTLRENRANVYSGIYEKGGKSLKYIVIVKSGLESEWGGGRAGNRGKRDSQLIITGLLNRIHYERELCDLDSAINHALNGLQVPAYEIEYLMTIDADTRVHEDSIHHMVWNMNKNEKILALCGETRVENKTQSAITMVQVFEYYTNHHMKKAFESVFGCVTCLPGCFTMYRVFSSDGRALIAQDNVFAEYSRNDIESLHEKNLYYLGEDRMLTTLLLKNFPEMRLSFVPEAACWTIVPHTFSILLSQRRRWINSTFHNMLELLKVKTMCGVCCLSMKMIVILDLISTMILPASMIYFGYFIYLVFVTGEEISMLMLILYGVIMGVQVVIFLLRSRWDYLWWFSIFLVAGIPLFYFVLPIYSFCKMDDFSWGTTRQVSKTLPQKAPTTGRTKQTNGGAASGPPPTIRSSSRQKAVDGRHSSRTSSKPTRHSSPRSADPNLVEC